jgi:hypothetical protein
MNQFATRWFVFGAVVIVCALFLVSQPPQNGAGLFALLTVGVLVMAVVSRRNVPAVNLPGMQLNFSQISVTSRQVWQLIFLIGGLVLMYIGQFQVYSDPQDFPTSTSYVLMIVGLGLIYTMLNGAVLLQTEPLAAPATAQPIRIRVRWMAISLFLFAFGSWRSALKPQEAYLGEHLLVWGLALLTFVIAFTPRTPDLAQPDSRPLQRWEITLLVITFIVAVLIRGINLGSEPYILDQDEAMFAQEGAYIRLEKFLTTPFEPGIHSWPRIHQSMIGLAVALLGPTLAAARLPSMLMGALSVPALYLLGREFGGRRIGLIATLFTLSWTFQVQFSRLALNQPGDPLFATLAFYFLLRGLRRGAVLDYVLCGFALGLAQLYYLAGRLMPFLMIAYVGFLFIRQRPLIMKQWRLLLLIPIAAFVLLIPHHFYLLHFNLPLTTRADKNIFVSGQFQAVVDNNQDVGQYLLRQFKIPFLALISAGDAGGWHGRGSNILGPFGAPLFLIGVIMSILVLWKRPAWSLPLGWGLAIILGGSVLSISPPQYQRYLIGAPAFALLVALGAETVSLAFGRILKSAEVIKPLALGIGGFLFIANLIFYLNVFIPNGKYLANRPNWATNRVASAMLEAQNAGRQVFLVPQYATGIENTLVVKYFMSGRPYTVIDQSLEEVFPTLDLSQPFTFIVAPQRYAELDYLLQQMKTGTVNVVFLDEDDSIGFYVYDVLASR